MKASMIAVEVKPFRVQIAQSAIDDLNRRLRATRFPRQLAATGWERGVTVDAIRPLVEYWIDGFDWRKAEARLNALPNFTAKVDGQTIHFIHVRSKEQNATPLLLIHAWPSSVFEFLDMIGPLTDPVAHGGKASDAFDLVIPSVPGIALSSPPAEIGWDNKRIARALAALMAKLGYARYGAHGSDLGALNSRELGFADPEHFIGAHVLQLFSFPSGDLAEFGKLSPEENRRLQFLGEFMAKHSGFATYQNMRPQTLAFALSDSPIGQLAWNYDLFADFGRRPQAIDRDAILSNVSLYWLTETAASAAAIYFENAQAAPNTEPSTFPIGVSVFADDFLTIRTFAERDNKNIVRWAEYDKGGHFAAMEEPQMVANAIRAFFSEVD